MHIYMYLKHPSGYFQLLFLGQEYGYCTSCKKLKQTGIAFISLKQWNQQFSEYLCAEPLYFSGL